jgi:hypothetical protein
MNALKFGIAVITFAIFVSCDCLQHVQGTVIDSGTRQPIKEVIIKKDTGLVIYTDSVGNFDITTMTGGLLGCPKISLSFEKEGYFKTSKKYSKHPVKYVL